MVRKVKRKKLLAFSFSLFMLFCQKCPMIFHSYNFQALSDPEIPTMINNDQDLSTWIGGQSCMQMEF